MNFFKKFQKLNIKNQDDKKKIISFAVTILGVLLVLTGTSVAYLMSRDEGTENRIVAGTLVLNLSGEGASLNLTDVLPVSDEIGLRSEASHIFSLENTGSLNSYYELRLTNDCVVGTAITIGGNSVTPDVCIPNEYIKIGLKKGSGEYEVNAIDANNVFYSGYIATGETINFELKLWLDYNTSNEYQGITSGGVERNVVYNGQLGLYYEQTNLGNLDTSGENLDSSGANMPELTTGMIPVYYDSINDVWRKADSNNTSTAHQWYSYASRGVKKGMWANAVTVIDTSSATSLILADDTTVNCANATCVRSDYIASPNGTIIPMSDINTMWVWIPRYAYNYVTIANYAGGTQANPGDIDINFISGTNETTDPNYKVMPAFTFGEQELKGIWVGKFENSATTFPTSISTTYQSPIIKPNVKIWKWTNLGTFWYSAKTLMNGASGNSTYGFPIATDSYDAHIEKSSEYAAVLYLMQSNYGRCNNGECIQLGSNNHYDSTNVNQLTGCGVAYAGATTSTCNAYNSSSAMFASATGTIYGIYDMSGILETTMGNYNNYAGYNLTSTGYDSRFNGYDTYRGNIRTGGIDIFTTQNAKYYDKYTTNVAETACNGNVCYGHALSETAGWYNLGVAFSTINSYPWLRYDGFSILIQRGGACGGNDCAYPNTTTRTVLAVY